MKKLIICMTTSLGLIASPASAEHIDHLAVPYDSRGGCESDKAQFSNDDTDSLLEHFPNFFSSEGEVRSFLNRAFTCDQRDDGNWYMYDHRREILASDWFTRRL